MVTSGTVDLAPRIVGGMEVGRLVLGTMTFGEQRDEAASAAVIHRARESGITMLDTANGYCDGRSEEIVGRVVAPFRDEVQIALSFLATQVLGLPRSH